MILSLISTGVIFFLDPKAHQQIRLQSQNTDMQRDFLLTPRVLAMFFSGIVITLLFTNLLSIYLKFVLGFTFHTMQIFHFNAEGNIPSIYSAAAILFSAFLLWSIGKLENEKAKKRTFYWKLLSLIFIFLAIDELISIHESFSDDSKDLLGNTTAGGLLHFAWIVPYALIFGFFALFMMKFLFQLPAATRNLFITAGIVFVSGAVGMEMIGGRYVFYHGKEELQYALMITFEEVLEMVGVVIFIYALSAYLIKNVSNKSIQWNVTCTPNVTKHDTSITMDPVMKDKI